MYIQRIKGKILVGVNDLRVEDEAKAYSTWYSQAVSHPSTNQARPCLASEIGRRPLSPLKCFQDFFQKIFSLHEILTRFTAFVAHILYHNDEWEKPADVPFP